MDATKQSSLHTANHQPTKSTMAIRIYNTLSKSKEIFEPVVPGKVGIYLCGPTVYKPSHIGHMVGPVIFDVIKKYLVYSGYDVTMVINITDVDDKLIAEANTRGLTMKEVAEEMTADYMANLKAMGIETIDHFPKATDNIDEIISIIESLIKQDFAYASEGDVYFNVANNPEYGKLSGRKADEMQGEGGSTAGRKKSSNDFALWKSAKPGEPSWDSPWGKGRPGWHIECSAMSRRILGETFDIHGGGLDLIFPHHENEVAQSECCHGKPQAKYWVHNGLMQAPDRVGKVGGRSDKQPESVTNDVSVEEQIEAKEGKRHGAKPFKELLATFPAETIRFFLLSTHYRRPFYFSDEHIQENETALQAFYRFFERYERITGESFYDLATPENREGGEFDSQADEFLTSVKENRTDFLESMDDDFNTGGAIGELMKFMKLLNRHVESNSLEDSNKRTAAAVAQLKSATKTLRELTSLLGLFTVPVETSSEQDDQLVNQLMELLIDLRAQMRTEKNFAVADQIRNQLTEIGVTLEDRADGTGWTVSK